MSNHDKVWLQPGTRAMMLVYRTDTQTWQVWTATDSRNGDTRTWLGTYMELHADGMCVQHNRTATSEEEFVVRPKFIHEEHTQ